MKSILRHGLLSLSLLCALLVSADTDNLAMGIPGKADTIVDREGYALGYNEAHEQAAWVSYKLTEREAVTKEAKRSDKFIADPAIPTQSATPDDYKGSGYDRGHLAPAADMAFSVKTMKESFFMSNMSPQLPAFNRGVWARLEEQVRTFAKQSDTLYVVTGPVLPKEPTVTIGSNAVTVPDFYYKVIYVPTPPGKMIGFILPNAGSNQPLSDFAVTVDAVEAATGLDFFSVLPEKTQEKLESTITITDWQWNDAPKAKRKR